MMNLVLRILFISFLLAYCEHVYAQIINADSVKEPSHLVVTSYAEVLSTKENLPPDSVISGTSKHKFQKAKDKAIVFLDYNPYYYWFRFQVRNTDLKPKSLILLMPPFGLREGKLYQKKGGNWQVVTWTGYGRPFLQRDYQYAHYAFPFTLPASALDTLYLYIDASKSYKSYAFALIAPNSLKVIQNKLYFSFGLIIGLLFLFAVFNLYLGIIYKDNIHLWYSLYIGVLILIVMRHDQLDQEFLGWDNPTAYRLMSAIGLGALAIGVLMHVVHKFLGKTIGKKLSLVSLLAKYNVLLSGITQLIVFYIGPDHRVQNPVFYWTNWSLRIAILVIIINCIYSIFKGYKVAGFVLAGLLVFLIGSFERILLTGSNTYLSPPTLFHVGMVMEVLVISYGLFYRYRLERKEKYAYLKEKEDLRNSYDEELLKSKIEIREQTLKTTVHVINDNIGRSISVIKNNLVAVAAVEKNDAELYISNSNALLTKVITDLRNLCKGLDTDHIRDIGLLKSIEYELNLYRKTGEPNAYVDITGDIYRIEPQKELILFRIYQTVLNKIKKDPKTNAIAVNLHYSPAAFQLIIAYEGESFDVIFKESDFPTDLDVSNIHNRSGLIGASLLVDNSEVRKKVKIILPGQ